VVDERHSLDGRRAANVRGEAERGRVKVEAAEAVGDLSEERCVSSVYVTVITLLLCAVPSNAYNPAARRG
jgi:hypothetical protein